MVTASVPGKAAGTPRTRCSSCRTLFEIAPELLASTDTRVRCGECYAIFDAVQNRVSGADVRGDDDAGVGDGVGDGVDTSALDATRSDFDLFSEEADLPEVACFDQMHDSPTFDFDSVDLDEDETFHDSLFARDATVDTRSASEGDETSTPGRPRGESLASVEIGPAPARPAEPVLPVEPARPIEPVRPIEPARSVESVVTFPPAAIDAVDRPSIDAPSQGRVEAIPRRGGRRWLKVSMSLLLVLLLAAFYGWNNRDRLHENPLTRSLYAMACRAIGCEVPQRVALDSLSLAKRNIYSHPTRDDALVIDVAFRNDAAFAQPFPALAVRLSDRSGRTVARHAFEPADYLATWSPGDLLEAGERLDISLEIDDPGQDASSFEVDFRETRAAR